MPRRWPSGRDLKRNMHLTYLGKTANGKGTWDGRGGHGIGMGRGVMECPMSKHVARILLGGGAPGATSQGTPSKKKNFGLGSLFLGV